MARLVCGQLESKKKNPGRKSGVNADDDYLATAKESRREQSSKRMRRGRGGRRRTTTTQGERKAGDFCHLYPNRIMYSLKLLIHYIIHLWGDGGRISMNNGAWKWMMDDGRWGGAHKAEALPFPPPFCLWLSSLCTCVVFSCCCCCCLPRLLHANSSARSVHKELEELREFTASRMMPNGVQ